MISIERQQINERFKELFHLLEGRGDICRNGGKKGMSISAIARIIFGKEKSGHIISSYLQNKRCIKHEEAKLFCALFHINPQYVLEGEGEAFQNQTEGKSDLRLLESSKNQIVFAHVEAFASSAEEVEAKGDCEYFQIPGLQGEFIAFSVSGSSMEPTIRDGDIIICRELREVSEIRDNEIYTIVANKAIMVKRVQRIWDKSRRNVIKLKLISDNYLEHDPFFVDVDTYVKVWKVERKITTL